jgi:aldehyde:ferredoxin oxidoreductase
MGKGYMGKILNVDLGSGKIQEEVLDESLYKNYIGGYGLAAKLTYDRQKGTKIDALGENNILGISSGLLVGTGSMFTGKFMMSGKSPLTGTWGDSNSGGHFSPMLKKSGYDSIFFTGKSAEPVYLVVNNGKAELKSAKHLWGKDALVTEDEVTKEVGGGCKVACIGPSGEKLSLISGVVNDKGRIAARSGLGAVMGSKKLKAIAVMGNQKIEPADRAKMNELTKEYMAKFKKGLPGENFIMNYANQLGKVIRVLMHWGQMKQESITYKALMKKYGTCGLTAFSGEGGDSPIKIPARSDAAGS